MMRVIVSGGVQRVERGEDQVAGFGGEQRRVDGVEVAHLADQDDVRILTQGAAQRAWRTISCRSRPRAG